VSFLVGFLLFVTLYDLFPFRNELKRRNVLRCVLCSFAQKYAVSAVQDISGQLKTNSLNEGLLCAANVTLLEEKINKFLP
jgi:hypothetical protein